MNWIFLLIVFMVLIGAELLYFKIADHFNIIDKPNERSSHHKPVLRGGGIIFLIGIWIYAAASHFSYPYFLAGLTLIAAVSFLDDIHSLPRKIRLATHIISILLILWQLHLITLENWWLVLLLLIVGVGMVNIYNFMDGINGITGGYSMAVLLPLWYLNQSLSFVDDRLIAIAVVSDLVFCFFNFRTKARCFAGDIGSMSMAFIIAFLLAKLIMVTLDFTYLLFLGLYGIDAGLTIVHRLLLHENIGTAHRKHCYQLLANEAKIPHTSIALAYSLLQLSISVGLLLLPQPLHWFYFMVIIVLLSMVYLFFIKKYYPLHEAYLKECHKKT